MALPLQRQPNTFRHGRALFLLLISSAFFSAMSTAIRHTRGSYTVTELIFFRGLLQALILLPWIRGYGAPRAKILKKFQGHFLRGTFGILSMYFVYLALQHAPIAYVSLLSLSSVLWASVVARIFLQESWNQKQVTFALITLGGLGLSLMGESHSQWRAEFKGTVSSILAGMFMGFALTTVKSLSQRSSTREIVFYFGCSGVLLMLSFFLQNPNVPNTLNGWSWLLFIALSGSLGQLFLTQSFRHTSTLIASLGNMTQLPINLFIGLLFLGETPPSSFIIGSVIAVVGFIGLLRLQS